MLSSIRNKTILGVLLLVLLVQVISTLLQSYQVQNMFTDEFVLGTQNLAQTVFFDLNTRVEEFQGNNVGDVDPEQMKEMFMVFARIVQREKFKSILTSKGDLQRMQFIDPDGELVVISRKTEEKIINQNRDKHPDARADDSAIQLARKGTLEYEQVGGEIYISVPFAIDETQYGSLVMTYSNERLESAREQIYLNGLLLVLAFMVIASVLVIIFVRRVVTLPIGQMISLVSRLADGELDQRFESRSRDEISRMGVSINELVTSLQAVFESIEDVMSGVESGDLSRKIAIDLKGDLDRIKNRINQSILLLSETIYSVRDTSQSVEQSARELSKSADDLSASSTRQAATIEEVSSSIAEIENHSRLNSEHATKAKEITNSTLELVNRGNAQMEEMQTAMGEINTTSQNITKIIKVIDEIAFQTNLLALNAAVEAARAGKYGKGFSVVAEEVRSLAARSAEAARDTSELIESSMKEVQTGVEKADLTNSILKEIVGEVERSNDLITLIADASNQQSSSISEINAGISNVNDAVQQNSAIAEETASSSEVLRDQSMSLQKEISRFKLSEEADHAAPAAEAEIHYPQITG